MGEDRYEKNFSVLRGKPVDIAEIIKGEGKKPYNLKKDNDYSFELPAYFSAYINGVYVGRLGDWSFNPGGLLRGSLTIVSNLGRDIKKSDIYLVEWQSFPERGMKIPSSNYKHRKNSKDYYRNYYISMSHKKPAEIKDNAPPEIMVKDNLSVTKKEELYQEKGMTIRKVDMVVNTPFSKEALKEFGHYISFNDPNKDQGDQVKSITVEIHDEHKIEPKFGYKNSYTDFRYFDYYFFSQKQWPDVCLNHKKYLTSPEIVPLCKVKITVDDASNGKLILNLSMKAENKPAF